jgi:uncharacterized protein YkwD
MNKFLKSGYLSLCIPIFLFTLTSCDKFDEWKNSEFFHESTASINNTTSEITTSTSTPTIKTTSTSLVIAESYEDIFNAYRKSKGLSPLIFTNDLNRIANLRLAEIKITYSHSSIGGYNKHLAENIVRSTGYLGNKEAFTSWKNSPGHNANMLNTSYKYTGYAISNGYAVQVFSSYETINGEPQLPPGWDWTD